MYSRQAFQDFCHSRYLENNIIHVHLSIRTYYFKTTISIVFTCNQIVKKIDMDASAREWVEFYFLQIILWKVELKFDDHTSILVKFISVTYVGDQVVWWLAFQWSRFIHNVAGQDQCFVFSFHPGISLHTSKMSEQCNKNSGGYIVPAINYHPIQNIQ